MLFAEGIARGSSVIIIFISLQHLITATGVYYVTPDDDQSDINNNCPIDHECHTLQYYLLNTSKYFTSNTQLHFLQGKFYINDDIVIDSLHNFSLVGSDVNNTLKNINFKYWGGNNITSNKLAYIIMVEFWQEYYNTEAYIEDTTLKSSYRVELIGISFWLCTSGKKLVVITGCQFLNNTGVPQTTGEIITITFPYCHRIIGFYHDSWMNAFIKNNINRVLILNSIF